MNTKERNGLVLALILTIASVLAGTWAVWCAYETYFFAKAARVELAK